MADGDNLSGADLWPPFGHLIKTYLVIHFDGLDVFPLLDGLCEVHHAQRHLHLPDLQQEVGHGNLGVWGDIPGHAWRICHSQKLQILMFCQRSHCREAETELHCKMMDFIT